MATPTTYTYSISPFDSNQFTSLIQKSAISVALDSISTASNVISILFKDALSDDDQTALANLVSAYIYAPALMTSVPNIAVQSTPPFGSKTISVSGVTKKLFSRYVGVQYPLTVGANVLTYTATLAWAKMMGVEAINSESLDTVDFLVLDDFLGTYSGTANAVLNQFSFTLNIAKDFYQRIAHFDADIYVGMVIKMNYVSVSNKTVGFNFIFNEVKS